MIQSTFVHLPGIGPETEARLWADGCRTWDDLHSRLSELFGPKRASLLGAALDESRDAYVALELAYFHQRLKGGEKWRLAADVVARGGGHGIAYLDIETTGLGFPPQSHCTSLAVLWGGELFVEHEKPRQRALVERLDAEAELLVSFNGVSFDVPFLRREFDVRLETPHLDLMHWFRKLGHRGGLKAIQTRFAHIPQRDSMDIDGFDAVRLWNLHRRGVPNALESLLAYNAEDTVVLAPLLHLGFELEAAGNPHLGVPTPPAPPAVTIPFEVCPLVYRMLRGNGS